VVAAIFVWSKRFCLWTRWNGIKFGQDCEVKFKKSFNPYCQNLFKVLANIGLISFHFHGQKLAKWCEGLIYAQKTPFSTKHPNWGNT
jgi:hypothetical protein